MLNVTIDGARQPGTTWHHAGNILVDPAFLKRVEVEAGAAAADAGFGAAVGAVRYETASALDLLQPGQTVGNRIKLGYGGNGQGVTSSLATYGKSEMVDWLLMANRQNGSNYKDGSGKEALGTEPKLLGGLAKLGWSLPQGHRLELSVEQDQDQGERVPKMNMGQKQTLTQLDLKRKTVTLNYRTTQPSAMWNPKISLWYNQLDSGFPDFSPASNKGDFQSSHTGYGLKAENTFKLQRGKLTAGLDGSRQNVDIHTYDLTKDASGDSYKSAYGVKEHDQQWGLYTQYRVNFDNGISLSTGGRYDWHALHTQDGKTNRDGGLSANATVSYLFNEHMEGYVGASRNYLGYQWGQTGLYHARDYVTVDGYEAATSLNQKIGLNFFGAQWKAGLGYFDTRLQHRTDLASGKHNVLGLNGKGARRNFDQNLRSKGWLLNASYEWAQTRLGMNATLAKVTQGNDVDGLLPEGGDAMPVGNTATVFIDHHLPNWNTRVGASVQIAQKDKFSELAISKAFVEQGSYALANVYAEWQPQGKDTLSLRIGIDNLFNRSYYTRSTYPMSNKVTPIMAPGRTLNVSGTWKF